MRIRNTSDAYGTPSKALHWLIFALILGLLIVGYLMEDIVDKPLRATVVNLHKLTGLTVLLLVVMRLCWTCLNVKPCLPGAALWEKGSERLVHYLLYAVMLVMPLSGWVMASAKRPPMLGSLSLGLPVPQSPVLKAAARALHADIAIAIIVLVSVHVLGALYHQFVKRDGVLRRMWFGG